jgi:hypothetical protein
MNARKDVQTGTQGEVQISCTPGWPAPLFLNLSGTADPLPKYISYILIKNNTDWIKYRENLDFNVLFERGSKNVMKKNLKFATLYQSEAVRFVFMDLVWLTV